MIEYKRLRIKEPYWGAGSPKKYDWVKDGYDMKGVGINVDLLTDPHFEWIKVSVTKFRWPIYVNCAKAMELAKKYKSFEKKKFETWLAIIPISAFSKYPAEMDQKDDKIKTP